MNAQPSPEALLSEAVAQHRAGRLGGAETLYRRVLEQQPGHPDALHLLGVVRSQSGDPAAGAHFIAQAIARRDGVAVYHTNLALALKALGRFAEAEAAIIRALALGAADPGTFVLLGATRRADGRNGAALTACRAALALAPASAAAQEGASHALAGMDDGAGESIIAYRRAYRLRPDGPHTAYNLACALQKAGHPAAAAYHAALALDPAAAAAWSNLGLTLLAGGGAAPAVPCLERAVRLRPDDGQDHFHLAEALHGAGDGARAAAAYKGAVERRPTDHTAWEQATRLDARAGRFDDLEIHAARLMAATRDGHQFWKAPSYIAMRVASELLASGLGEPAEQVLIRFRQAAAQGGHGVIARWIEFLHASLLLRDGGERAVRGRAELARLTADLPFLQHVTFDDEFDALCRSVTPDAIAAYAATFQCEPLAEPPGPGEGLDEGPLVYAACDERYLRLFAGSMLAALDAFSGPGQRVHLHVVDPPADFNAIIAELRGRLKRCRLVVSTENAPADFDAETRLTFLTSARLMRAPQVLALYGNPLLIMIDVDVMVLIDPRQIGAAMAPGDEAALIHRPESLDYLYNTISNGFMALRPTPRIQSCLQRTAVFLLHWFNARNMAYFLDQVALIQGLADAERHYGPAGVLRIETLGERLNDQLFFFGMLNEKHRPDFRQRMAVLEKQLRVELDAVPERPAPAVRRRMHDLVTALRFS